MHKFLDYQNGDLEVKGAARKLSFLFAAIFALVILGVALLLIGASYQETWRVILATILTIFFLLFAVYFFTCPFAKVNKWLRFYSRLGNGERRMITVKVLSVSKETVIHESLPFYPVEAVDAQTLEQRTHTFYVLEDPGELKAGKVYEMKVSGPYIMEAKSCR